MSQELLTKALEELRAAARRARNAGYQIKAAAYDQTAGEIAATLHRNRRNAGATGGGRVAAGTPVMGVPVVAAADGRHGNCSKVET